MKVVAVRIEENGPHRILTVFASRGKNRKVLARQDIWGRTSAEVIQIVKDVEQTALLILEE